MKKLLIALAKFANFLMMTLFTVVLALFGKAAVLVLTGDLAPGDRLAADLNVPAWPGLLLILGACLACIALGVYIHKKLK